MNVPSRVIYIMFISETEKKVISGGVRSKRGWRTKDTGP